MKVKDISDYGIKNVTPEDITGTGAPLDSVNLFLIRYADEFIGRAGLPVVWLPNGLTSGAHRASWHPRGLAWDLAFNCEQKHVKMYDLWKLAIECQFKGIGVYWNGVAYSMHLDLRPKLSTWGGVKEAGKEWDYFSIFLDPRDRGHSTCR